MPKFSAYITRAYHEPRAENRTAQHFNIKANNIDEAYKEVYDNHTLPGDNFVVESEDHMQYRKGYRRLD